VTTTTPGVSRALPAWSLDPRTEASRWDRFEEALAPRLMGPRLAVALGGGRRTCHVLDAKYEPGVRATVLYEYDGRMVRGDLVPITSGRDAGPVGHDVLVVPPGVRLFPFPHDPDIPALPLVMDVTRLGPALREALPDSVPAAARGRVGCRLWLMRYRPGRRATVLVAYGRSDRLVAKAYHDPVKAAAVASEATALAAASRSSRDALRLPPTLAHLEELALVVQRHVPGAPLQDVLRTTTAGPGDAAGTALAQAARSVAELHERPDITVRRRPVDRELRRFAERARRASWVDAGLGASAGRLAERLVHVEAGLPPAVMGPVHGDCKPGQFLVTGDGVYMLDLDHLGLSDQAADVGTFLATLRQQRLEQSLRSPGSTDATARQATWFLEAYLSARGDRVSPARIQWQEAVGLLRKALRAFSRAPRSPVAAALLAEADHCLDSVEEGR
jgi:hypothetical protein